jgi:hypothetical protein
MWLIDIAITMGSCNSRTSRHASGNGCTAVCRLFRWIVSTALLLLIGPTIKPQSATLTEIQPSIPWGGRAVAVTVSPTNTNVAVAASFSGGLFRSIDGGNTWRHLDSFAPNRLSDVQFNPVNPSELVASVLNDSHTSSFVGVWMSRDGGNTWTQAQLPPCNNPAFGRRISFGPAPNIFVGTDCGLAASHNDGVTWNWAAGLTSVPSVVSQPGPNFPADPNSVQVDVCDGGGTPQHSTDNGSSFSSLPAPGAGCISIAESPLESNVLFAATNAAELWELDGLNASWSRLENFPSCCRKPWVRTGPKYPGPGFALYFHSQSDLSLTYCTSGGPGHRCPGVTGFATFPYGAHHEFGEIAVPVSGCKTYLAGDGGIETSLGCAGPPWAESNRGFDALQIYRIAGTVHPDHTDLYIGTQDNGIWASPDGGVTWENSILFDGYIVEAPHSSSAPGQYVGVTGISGTPWNTFAASADLASQSSFPLPPLSGQYPDFYLVGGGDQGPAWFVHTDDGCDPPSTAPCFLYAGDVHGNWVKQSPALPFKLSGVSRRLYVSGPEANPTIYVTTNKIAPNGTSIDGLSKITGINQSAITIQAADIGLGALALWVPDDAPALYPRVVGVDPNNPQHLIAADFSSNKMVVSTSGGTSWTPDVELTNLVTSNGNLQFNEPFVGCQAHAIAFDPANGQRIFVGTEASGVIATVNGGQNWFRIPGSDRITSVSDFFFDDLRGVLYVASYGRGLWTIRGLTPPPTIQITNLSINGLKWCATVTATEGGQPISGTVTVHGTTGATGQQICFLPCYTLSTETECDPNRKPPCRIIKIRVPASCPGTLTVGSQAIPISVPPPPGAITVP